jgi:hypothetical protein
MAVTDEQQIAVDLLAAGKDVVLEAHYGSGKTTTILAAVDAVSEQGGVAVCLAYNANMKGELRRRRRREPDAPPVNHTTHSLHSAAQCYYVGVSGASDAGVTAALTAELSAVGETVLGRATHLLVDEAQDLTALLFSFVLRLRDDVRARSGRTPALMLVGDARQAVNRWNDADSRFLTLAPELVPSGAWVRCELTRTFRCPPEVVDLNNAVAGLRVRTERVPAPGERPVLVRCDVWDTSEDNPAYRQVMAWLDEGYTREDILVLVPSLKRSTPSHVLQTLLGAAGVATHQAARRDSKAGGGSLSGKVRFATYHASKGAEAACVLALCFDASCDWLSEGFDDCALPPPFHVAMTRCKERLMMVQSRAADAVPALAALGEASLFGLVDVRGEYSLKGSRATARGATWCTPVPEYVEQGVTEEGLEAAICTMEWRTAEPAVFEDVDGDEFVLESAPSVVSSKAADDATEDVAAVNAIIATTVLCTLLGVDFGCVPALRSLAAPSRAFQCLELDWEDRLRLRSEYVQAGDAPPPRTATLAALVLRHSLDGYTTLLEQVRDRCWWTDEHVAGVRDNFESALRGLLGLEVADVWRSVTADTEFRVALNGGEAYGRALVARPRDGRTLLVDTVYDDVVARPKLAALLLYAHAAGAAGVIADGDPCLTVSLRTGEAHLFRYDRERVEQAVLCLTPRSGARRQRLTDADFVAAHGVPPLLGADG